jgi:hypothetical protein
MYHFEPPVSPLGL